MTSTDNYVCINKNGKKYVETEALLYFIDSVRADVDLASEQEAFKSGKHTHYYMMCMLNRIEDWINEEICFTEKEITEQEKKDG